GLTERAIRNRAGLSGWRMLTWPEASRTSPSTSTRLAMTRSRLARCTAFMAGPLLRVDGAGDAHCVLGGLDYRWRQREGAVEDFGDALAGDFLDGEILPLGVGDERRVVHRGMKRAAQRRHPLGRYARRRQDRAIHLLRRQNELQHLPRV